MPWLTASLALYVMVGACRLPVVWLQRRMHAAARDALRRGEALPARYATYCRCWFLLGWPAFIGVLAIFYLMVFKPARPSAHSTCPHRRQRAQSNYPRRQIGGRIIHRG